MAKYILRIDAIGNFYLNMIRSDPILNGKGFYEYYNYNDIIESIIYFYYFYLKRYITKDEKKELSKNIINTPFESENKKSENVNENKTEFKIILKGYEDYINIFKSGEEKVLSFYSSQETEKILNLIKENMKWDNFTNINVLKNIFNQFIDKDHDLFRDIYRDLIFFGSAYGLDPQDSIKLVLTDFTINDNIIFALNYIKYDLVNWKTIINYCKKEGIHNLLYKEVNIPSYTMNFYLEDFLLGFEFINFLNTIFNYKSHFSYITFLRLYHDTFEKSKKENKKLALYYDKAFIKFFEFLLDEIKQIRNIKF